MSGGWGEAVGIGSIMKRSGGLVTRSLRVGQSISSHSAANILGMVDTLGNAKRCKTIFRILKSLNGCFSDLVRGVISVRQCGKYHAYPEYLTTIAYTSSP